jgi:flagellar biosynthetic protein FliR
MIGTLILIRVTGMMASAPFFRNSAIPTSVKILLSILLSLVITTAYWKDQPTFSLHLWNITYLVFKEFMVGLIIGFSANTVFYAARFAGGLIDSEMGYQTGALFDPESANPSLMGEFKELMTLMVFLFINGHHYIIESMFISIKAVPLTTFEISQTTVLLLTKMATTVLMLGIKLASPLLVAMFLTNLALALLARIAPQTNIFSLSFQFKVAIGLVVLFLSVPLAVLVAKYSLQGMQTEVLQVILSLLPSRVQ